MPSLCASLNSRLRGSDFVMSGAWSIYLHNSWSSAKRCQAKKVVNASSSKTALCTACEAAMRRSPRLITWHLLDAQRLFGERLPSIFVSLLFAKWTSEGGGQWHVAIHLLLISQPMSTAESVIRGRPDAGWPSPLACQGRSKMLSRNANCLVPPILSRPHRTFVTLESDRG